MFTLLKTKPYKMLIRACCITALSTLSLPLTGCSPTSPETSLIVASQGVYSAALPSQSNIAVIASLHHGASLWDLTRGARLYNWNHTDDYTLISAVALSEDQSTALTASTHQLATWSTASGKSLGFLRVGGRILSASLSKKGDLALLGLDNYSAVFINLQTTLAKALPHPDQVNSISLAEKIDIDGARKIIGLSGSNDNKAYLWDLNHGSLLKTWQAARAINHVNLSTDGTWALLSSQHDNWSIRRTSRPADEPAYLMIKRRDGTITASTFSHNERYLLLGNTARQIELWDLKQKEKLAEWRTPKRELWSPIGNRLMGVGFNKNLTAIYAVTSSGELHSWPIQLKQP